MNNKNKREYFSDYGSMVYSAIGFMYFIWYIWYFFFQSNPVFGNDTRVVLFIFFWISILINLSTFFTFIDGPDFIVRKKFEFVDVLTFIGLFFVGYIIAAIIYQDLFWIF